MLDPSLLLKRSVLNRTVSAIRTLHFEEGFDFFVPAALVSNHLDAGYEKGSVGLLSRGVGIRYAARGGGSCGKRGCHAVGVPRMGEKRVWSLLRSPRCRCQVGNDPEP